MGHLWLTFPLTVCVTLSATPVVPFPGPGAAPVIPAGTTGPEAASLRYAHNAAKIVFNMFQNIERPLCQQHMVAVKDNLVRVLHMPHQGYSTSCTLNFIAHQYVIYAVIVNANWIANDKRLQEAYAPTNPIEVLWRKIDDAVAYAEVGLAP